jgi:L-lactate dehydrogenase complex protein LldG
LGSALDRFETAFTAAGGEVVRLGSTAAAAAWAEAFAADFGHGAQSHMVPPLLRLPIPDAAPEVADLGVSWAADAIAETGSLLVTSREGRRLQLLPPTHLVWVPADRVVHRLEEALTEARPETGRVWALHSGPSKSADIGRIVVTGVHGPGRVVAAVVELESA